MINTLVLSGGGPSGISYIGVYRALLENDFLKKNEIKEIITTSIGILISFCILININYNILYQVSTNSDLNNLLDYSQINIDNLLLEFGVFDTSGIENIFVSLIKNILKKTDITLHELYDISNITLTVKVFNTTLKKNEYISHLSHPNLSIITLAKMTTAIPFFFKPISYDNQLYVDGGLRGSLPLERCKDKNFIAIKIHGNITTKSVDYPIIDYIISLMTNEDSDSDCDRDIKKNILHLYPKLGLNFDLDKDLIEKIIDDSYRETVKFLANN
tara:strand:+ start:4826 stop:5644 length:819 start_codon:yes stop_codon:yes gene_type:complete